MKAAAAFGGRSTGNTRMRRSIYLIHLLAWLAFVVGVRVAMVLWTEWLAGLVLLPLPFYLVHDKLLWRWRRQRGPLYAACRSVRLRLWHRGRRPADESDALPHKPHGFCPKCGYPVNLGRCPECGHEITLANIRAERSGVLRRHRWKFASAFVIVLLYVAGHIFITKTDWISRLSVEHVITLHEWGYGDAEYELERRVRSRTLTADQLKTLLEHAVVADISVPSPYPHDAKVPCQLSFTMTVRWLGSGTYFFIHDWTCELDGKPIEQDFSPDEPTGRSGALLFTLPDDKPGEHIVRIRGQVILASHKDARLLSRSTIYSMPFTAEASYEADDRSASEMIAASQQPLVEDQPDVCPFTASTGTDTWYDPIARRPHVSDRLSIWLKSGCNTNSVIAGRVLARPKGKGEFIDVGGCYLYRDYSVSFDIGDQPKLKRARQLEIRIEPDAREAAFHSRMRCRRFYAKTLEFCTVKKKRKGGIFSWGS